MINLKVYKQTMLADTQTPVSIYLKVRDMFPESALLESSDYNSTENSFSFIGIEPIARFKVKNGTVSEHYPNGEKKCYKSYEIENSLNIFLSNFNITGDKSHISGVLGYTSYDSVRYFESINIKESNETPPEMIYILYRYIVAVNHLSNEMTISEHLMEGEKSGMHNLISIMESRNYSSYNFKTTEEIKSTISDEKYKSMVEQGISHCARGDVFQIVLSRRFSQKFKGDDFKVYRALRSVNPSPYLFYFDFGEFRIFGSSPETHLKIDGNTATIDPIAGTFHRTGNDERDHELALKLTTDPKENAEHVMLVDLARNDLSRNANNVYVKSYKQIQFYSHVIHLVSRVCGTLQKGVNRIKIYADTFPAGTLSGAPKVRAMQLINEIETHPREVYGGSIGYIGFDGNLNQAITIRTFLSRGNTLQFQAGAGITIKSNPESELKEVNGKLGALRRAIELAETLKN